MKCIYTLLVLLLTAYNIDGQVNYHIQFDTTLIPRWNYDPPWKYGAEFDIEDELKPLTSSKVNFTLNSFIIDIRDWTIRLAYLESNVEVTGDTLFYWPGPHEIGDLFSGSFYVKPLRSGGGIVALASAYPPHIAMDREAGIVWCFDEDGVLRFLDQIGSDHKACFKSIVYFFNQDSIYIEQDPTSKKVFDYSITITPIPRIGDTSIMRLNLASNYDIPSGCDLKIDAYGFDIASIPDTFNYRVETSESIELAIGFIPKAVREGHVIGVTLFNCSHSPDKWKNRQDIYCCFLFDDNGLLKYIGKSSLRNIDEDKKPTTFREIDTSRDRKVITLRAVK